MMELYEKSQEAKRKLKPEDADNFARDVTVPRGRAGGGGGGGAGGAGGGSEVGAAGDSGRFLTTARYARNVVEFARYLGIDPVFECGLLWIAEEAMLAPMPPGWSEHEDASGHPYFYNLATDESVRTHPLDGYYRSLHAHERRILMASRAAESRKKKTQAGGAEGSADAAGSPGSPGKHKQQQQQQQLSSGTGHGPIEVGAPAAVAYELPRGRRVVVEPPSITPYELMAMAKYLHLDVLQDFHLLWIAEEALKAPLPPQFEEHVDPEGFPFFYNTETDESSRDHPADDHFLALVASERERWHTRRDQRELDANVIKPWMKFKGQMGNHYYFNFRTMVTADELPDAPEVDVSTKTPVFKFAMVSPPEFEVKRLVFFSWFTERGEVNERVEVELSYLIDSAQFRVSYARAKPSVVAPTTRHGNVLEAWDLCLGSAVSILGKRHTLLKADASTIAFIDHNVRRLDAHRAKLAQELAFFEVVPERLAETIKGEKAHVSMRQVIRQILELRTKLQEYETA